MMADLATLVDRWFIDTNKTGEFPPQTRHSSSSIPRYQTGNLVTPLVDGENYLPAWRDGVADLTGESGDRALFHSGWVMSNIDTTPGPGVDRVFTVLADARKAGVSVNVALSDHWLNASANRHAAHEVGPAGAVDSRFADVGSNHQKFTVFTGGSTDTALVGSADLWSPVMTRVGHDQGGKQHELSVKVEGPVVADIYQTFSNRWNDSTRDDVEGSLWHPEEKYDTTSVVTTFLEGYDVWTGDVPPKVPADPTSTTQSGSHAVQVLETYGIDHDDDGTYSWANYKGGEFTVWAARLKAIKNARHYVYVEDQFFVPFGWPPACESNKPWAPFTQLGNQLRAGRDVFVVTNPSIGGTFGANAEYNRLRGLVYLRDIAAQSSTGDLSVATLEVDGKIVGSHAKFLLCDDEYVAIGSANFNRRSATNDGELALGIVDPNDQLVEDIRRTIWAEHLDVAPNSLLDRLQATQALKQGIQNSQGNLKTFEIPETAGDPPLAQAKGMSIWDPYGGPTVPGGDE